MLEHVEQPLEFIRSLRRTLDAERGTPVYFEVPNGEYQLANGVVWDMIYAHHSTFTEAVAARRCSSSAASRSSRSARRSASQYLWIEARPVEPRPRRRPR